MKIIWVRSDLPLSLLIRWGLGENSSHVGLLFDDKLFFNSELTGCKPLWFKSYLKTRSIVYQIEYDFSLEQEEKIYQSVIDVNDGKGYDIFALFYFIWRGFLFKYFKIPFPKKNRWSVSGKFICTGLLSDLPKELFPELQGIDLDMVSPDTVFRILLNSSNPHKVTKPLS